MSLSYRETYLNYIQTICPDIELSTLDYIDQILIQTEWEDPQSPIDFNNLAVLALIEAEHSQDLNLRELYLETAIESLNQKTDGHPLCEAHIALIQTMLGRIEDARNLAFSSFIKILHCAHTSDSNIPSGLVYFPQAYLRGHQQQAKKIIENMNGWWQSLSLLSEALCQSNLVFYNEVGLRFLNLAVQVSPRSTSNYFKLGIAKLLNYQQEGILHLHQAAQLSPASAPILQSLYLAYKDIENIEIAKFWLESAQRSRLSESSSLDWQWSYLGTDSSITYVPFESSLLLAVEPSFHSIVTSVLLAEGDWFEQEIEFWRDWIQPGMTVIDVGANVGIYTFSAALKVGSQGRVVAVEPFSGCIRCLEETCRINQLDWVKIYSGAATNYNGQACLALHNASELNEVIIRTDNLENSGNSLEEVKCFALDTLIQEEGIDTVDFMKIDAEGHEIQVLEGSRYILNNFSPIILYENLSGNKGSNLHVANFLKDNNYQLFHYQPYLQQLIPLLNEEQLQGKLNIIALPIDKARKYLS
jgi:FkbM family methyltransferase